LTSVHYSARIREIHANPTDEGEFAMETMIAAAAYAECEERRPAREPQHISTLLPVVLARYAVQDVELARGTMDLAPLPPLAFPSQPLPLRV
jgi:hypothetical protein